MDAIERRAVEKRVLVDVGLARLLEAMEIFPCLCTAAEGQFIGRDANDGAVLSVQLGEFDWFGSSNQGQNPWEAAESS